MTLDWRAMTPTLDDDLALRWRKRVPQGLISAGPAVTLVVLLAALPDRPGSSGTDPGGLQDLLSQMAAGAGLCVAVSGMAARIPAQIATVIWCAGLASTPLVLGMIATVFWTVVLCLDLGFARHQATLVRRRSPVPRSLDIPAAAFAGLTARRDRVVDACWAAACAGTAVWALLTDEVIAAMLTGAALTVLVRRPLTRWVRRVKLSNTAQIGRPLACRVWLHGERHADVGPVDADREVASVRRLAWLGAPPVVPEPIEWLDATVVGMERDGSMAIIVVPEADGAKVALSTKPVRDPWFTDPGDYDMGQSISHLLDGLT